MQWLRHGCLPVIVVEGRPPQEKRAAQQARFASRNGYAGGGSQQGASQFQRLGQTLGMMLEELVSGSGREEEGWGGLGSCSGSAGDCPRVESSLERSAAATRGGCSSPACLRFP